MPVRNHHRELEAGWFYQCIVCEKNNKSVVFKRRDRLRRHLTNIHFQRWFVCGLCGAELHMRDNITREFKSINQTVRKDYCPLDPLNIPELLFHMVYCGSVINADVSEIAVEAEPPPYKYKSCPRHLNLHVCSRHHYPSKPNHQSSHCYPHRPHHCLRY